MKITDVKVLNRLFLVSWIIYFISYIGRLNYTASMVAIGSSEGYTTGQLGIVVTALFISYGMGQLISGICGDHYSPRRLVLFGIIGCALCNLLVFGSTEFWQIVVSWFINGLSLAFIWPPMMKIFTKYMPKDYLHKSCFNIQTSVAFGTFFVYVLCSMTLIVFTWRAIFVGTAVLLFGAAWLWNSQIKKIEAYSETCGQEEEVILQQKKPSEQVKGKAFLKLCVTSGLMVMLVAVLIMGFLKDGIMTWVPAYITDTFEVSDYFSILLTAWLPLVNLAAVYGVKYIHKKSGDNDIKTGILFFGISIISLIGLMVWGDGSLYLTVCLFAVVTSCMLGINIILVGILPIYFDKYNKTSTVAGITNCVTYLGSALCGYGLGAVIEQYGWDVIQMILIGACAIGVFACIVARKRWQEFKKSYNES